MDHMPVRRDVDNRDQSKRKKFRDSSMAALQQKYNNSIRIDFHTVDSLSVIHIDMIALRRGLPYPIGMHQFPTLVVSDNFDYVKHLRSENKCENFPKESALINCSQPMNGC